jgi:hypothetical protein
MGSENADIDDVLKESEALLDRLQSKSSNSTTNDVYDGGASLASLGSLSLRDAASVLASVADSAVQDAGSGVDDTSGTGVSFAQFPASSAEIKGSMVRPEALPASQPRPPPQWEKVSSAAMGDDDYVPIVDYTKEKSINMVPTIRASKARISRLEAYREKARKKRRTRRVVAFVLAVLLAFVFWAWSKRAHLARDEQTKSGSSSNSNVTNTTNITFAGSEDSFGTETDSPHLESPGAESCPITVNAEFSKSLEESRPVKSKNKVLVTETEKESKQDRSADESAVPAPSSPSESDVQTNDVPSCKHFFAKIFSRKCRKMPREGKNLLLEVAAYLQ